MPDERGSRAIPSVDELGAAGRAAGIDALGVAGADPFDDTRAVLEARKAAGLHGGMQFTYRNPARSTDPSRVVPGARALVVGARGYRRQEPPGPPGSEPAGRVARYARHDHYGELRAGLGAVAAVLRGHGWAARVVCDDNALVDRAAAQRAGLGWYGKSANLLLPGMGSWFVLGSVVTDAPLPASAGPVADGCGPCTRCLDACPTGAIVGPGVVDARRCLAWLVQAPGSIPVAFRAALGDRIYGCDDCQEVCPPNRGLDRRSPAPDDAGDGAWVGLLALLASGDDALLEAHGRWYVPDRDPRYLRRNAIVALGNVGRPDDPAVTRTLDAHAGGNDALLAEHARWALDRLGERARARA
ncbi:MAG: tRNA epoxyqueuosine(34) reductase QueG [Acidimicrobiia bacterium]